MTSVPTKRYGIIQIVLDVVRNELDLADDSVAQQRRQFCISCDARSLPLNLCTACGCHIPTKTKLVKAACPRAHW